MILFHMGNTFLPIGHPFSPFIDPILGSPEPRPQDGPSEGGTRFPLSPNTLGYMKSSTLYWGKNWLRWGNFERINLPQC